MTLCNSKYKIRKLFTKEIENALNLVWNVFEEFEAPEYSREGVNNFKDFIEYSSISEKIANHTLSMYGCFGKNELAGIIAVREFKHICLLFVSKDFQRQGIAVGLCKYAINKCKKKRKDLTEITVNSSPYAVGFYHKINFKDIDEEQVVDGIRFTPMKYLIKIWGRKGFDGDFEV